MVQTKLIISSFNNLRGILKGPPDLPDFKFVIIFSIPIHHVGSKLKHSNRCELR